MTEHPTRKRDASDTAARARRKRANLYELDTPARARAGSRLLYEAEADALKALAHPKRLMIVDLLSDGSERNVSELQQQTGLSQSNLSQNLAILRAAGIVTPRRDANAIYYHVTDPRVLKAVALLRGTMETKLEDKAFLAERDSAKTRERAKNASLYSIAIVAGLLVAGLAGAAAMPLFVGGDLNDVAHHTNTMLSNPTLGTFVETCREMLSEGSHTPNSTAPPA